MLLKGKEGKALSAAEYSPSFLPALKQQGETISKARGKNCVPLGIYL